MLNADAAAMCDAGEFGEAITYTPYNGLPLTFNAIVLRESPAKAGPTPRMQVVGTTIHFAKSQVASVKLSGDTVLLAGDEKPRTVVRILDESDAGMWNLELKQ